MIKFRFPEEKEALHHYANVLDNKTVENVLHDGIRSTEDARELASFFWKMVDQTVVDNESNISVAGYTNLESLCEDLMQSLRSHFIATGYMEIWEEESDKA
jgi:hypothetical protein